MSYQQSSPLVSIITVNYRNPKITVALLRSLHKCELKDTEVIVVENAPLRDSRDQYQQAYPGVVTIVSQLNVGFAGGNNLGIKAARGRYLFFLNNDTELLSDAINPLIDVFEREPLVGAVCPKIRYFHEPGRIQFAGFTKVGIFGRNRMIGKNEVDTGQHNRSRYIPYGHGAALMVRREVIEQVGMMPETYFLYYEELDWSAQIVRAGYQIKYEPQAIVYHKESMTVGRLNALKTFYLTRNRIVFMRRNMPWWHRSIFYLYFIIMAFPKNLIGHLLKREWKHIYALCKGTIQGLGLAQLKVYT